MTKTIVKNASYLVDCDYFIFEIKTDKIINIQHKEIIEINNTVIN